MRASDPRLGVIREWVAKAEADLLAAAHLLKLDDRAPTEVVSFHAQQCVEKYMKALLVTKGTDFPKTHDLDRLAQLLGSSFELGLSDEERAELSDHAIAARYPGSGEIPLRDARRALRLARRARTAARKLLPALTLRAGSSKRT